MPQISPRGKFVFGWSIIQSDGSILIPAQTREEYALVPCDRAILISGTKTSGAFSVGNWQRLEQSVLANILVGLPALTAGEIAEGEILPYKGRRYGWATLHPDGRLRLPLPALAGFGLQPGDYLLSIRGSYIAFDFAVKGPLVERARPHTEIPIFA
jgi:hypothetical protein